MIKKILLTLLVLIILAVLGIVALVVFVDPNNFKGFISDTVRDKTGYELTIEGDLRWHIWPQISILTDSVLLEDEGAKKPILTADNMRLDVELFPLFSKELSIKNVLVKSASINVTDQSKGKVAKSVKTSTTVNQTQSKNEETSASSWSFSLNKLEIIDSTVLLQQDKDIISFRNIDASILQKDDKNVELNLSGNINRDQQDFNYSLNATVNLTTLPEHATVNLHKFSYSLQGVGVPAGGLKGDVKATLNYQKSPLTLSSNDFVLTLNDNQVNGTLKANLDKKPYFEALFNSKHFNLTPFLSSSASSENSDKNTTQSKPVVATKTSKGNELAFLQSFDAKFGLNINQVIANNVKVDNFELQLTNQNGVANLSKVSLDIAEGHIIANGQANGKQPTTLIKLATKATDIDLGVLFAQLSLAQNFKGQFNADGNIATTTIVPENIMAALTGNLAITVNNARLENLNIQHIVQLGVAQYTKEEISSQEYQKYSEFHEVSAKATLANGDMNLSSIKALSESLVVTGDGRIGLTKQDLDIDLLVKILSGWNEKSQTIQKLQKIAIPLRIYGTFDKIHYKLEADKVIKELLNNKLQNELEKLKDRLNSSNNSDNTEQADPSGNSEQKSDKQKAKELLGGFLNKLSDKNKE